VVIAIIAVLIGLLLPAVQSADERRAKCCLAPWSLDLLFRTVKSQEVYYEDRRDRRHRAHREKGRDEPSSARP
jgi:hypothetical protein